MTVGERIKQRRLELSLTQAELAKRAGYSNKADISKMENAGDDIGMNRIKRIAPALSVSVEYLMGWDTEKIEDSPTGRPDKNIAGYTFISKNLNEEAMEVLVEYQKLSSDKKNWLRGYLGLSPLDDKGDAESTSPEETSSK